MCNPTEEYEEAGKQKQGVVRGTAFIITGGKTEKFSAVKFPRQCPLILLEKVGWRQGTELGIEDSEVAVRYPYVLRMYRCVAVAFCLLWLQLYVYLAVLAERAAASWSCSILELLSARRK